MIVYPLLKGSLLALVTIGMSLMLPEELVYPFFALLLSLAAGVYVGFAVVDTSGTEYILQWVVALGFVGLGLIGIWISPYFLAAGWILHAIWDLLHHKHVLKTKTEEWYPPFCLSYDLVVAGFIIYLA